MAEPGGKLNVVQIITNAIATDTSAVIEPWSGRMTFQAHGQTSAGAGTATILIEASLDNTNFITLGTLSLTLATTTSSDGIAIDAPWQFIRARITVITGTDATVNVFAGG